MSELCWISASERLPEVGQIVGIRVDEGGRAEQIFGCYDGERWFDEDGVETLVGRVTAWVSIRIFLCPHCGHAAHPNTLSLQRITLARCQCHHCASEFLIADDKPVRLAEYLRMNPPMSL